MLVHTNFYLNYNILLLKYLFRNFYAFYVNLLNFYWCTYPIALFGMSRVKTSIGLKVTTLPKDFSFFLNMINDKFVSIIYLTL